LHRLISTTTAVYRGKFGILEHALGGCAAGMLYKFNIGSRGVIVGAAVGKYSYINHLCNIHVTIKCSKVVY